MLPIQTTNGRDRQLAFSCEVVRLFCATIDPKLTRGGGEYFAGNGLTVADLKAFVQTRSLRSGKLDHVPADLVQRLAPGLVEHQERIEGDHRVAVYYDSRS